MVTWGWEVSENVIDDEHRLRREPECFERVCQFLGVVDVSFAIGPHCQSREQGKWIYRGFDGKVSSRQVGDV